MSSLWPRVLMIAGVFCLIIGAIDPLEGSVVILAGGALLALGGFLGKSRQLSLLVAALILLAVGIGAMFGLSALGGIGGSSGRSMAWIVLLVPYPVGWVLGLIGAYRGLRRPRAVAHA